MGFLNALQRLFGRSSNSDSQIIQTPLVDEAKISSASPPQDKLKFFGFAEERKSFLYCGKNKISGVTKSFNAGSSQRILKTICRGDRLFFKKDSSISASDFRRVKVVDARNQQLGWCDFGLYEFNALMENFSHHIATDVFVSGIGMVVGDRGENIIWCEISFSFPIHYDSSEKCAFIANHGKVFHLSSTCRAAANMEVPMSYVEYRRLRPCPKCAPQH